MCKLVEIKNNTNNIIKVASIKAETIQKIIEYASSCSKIDYIYLFGSSIEERCTEKSDIDLAIISNITRSRLYHNKTYDKFKTKIYNIDDGQDYDFLHFNSLKELKNSKDRVCKDILENGVMLYIREGMKDGQHL